MAVPKVAAINDLSGLGKCSLTAAIPILSVCGVQAVPMPTAVLSNQTAFESYTGIDLSMDMPMIAAEWKKRKVSFDGIYTGYLGSFEQIDLAKKIFEESARWNGLNSLCRSLQIRRPRFLLTRCLAMKGYITEDLATRCVRQ